MEYVVAILTFILVVIIFVLGRKVDLLRAENRRLKDRNTELESARRALRGMLKEAAETTQAPKPSPVRNAGYSSNTGHTHTRGPSQNSSASNPYDQHVNNTIITVGDDYRNVASEPRYQREDYTNAYVPPKRSEPETGGRIDGGGSFHTGGVVSNAGFSTGGDDRSPFTPVEKPAPSLDFSKTSFSSDGGSKSDWSSSSSDSSSSSSSSSDSGSSSSSSE